jgi:ElaB/YqjD/DUF883 family membrane-anchored ribosome-binding protein
MNVIRGLFECLKGSVDDSVLGTPSRGQQNAFVSEKGNYHHLESSTPSTPTAATKAVLTLQSAEKAGRNLQATIEDIVTEAGGWSEQIAVSILAMLENILKAGSPLGQAMKEAYDKACEAAKSLGEFIHDHPIWFTIIALGILVILAPAVLEALGFGALGPVEGKYSAAIR